VGNSTIKLSNVFNVIAAKGIPDPRGGPSGYGDQLALELANEVMADIVCERYNQKWNRAFAAPFYTNSYQQDYPQLAQTSGPIGWGEDGDVIDVNNTIIPKPLCNIKWRRGLSRTNVSCWWPQNLSWIYNAELEIAVWPGSDVIIYPLLGATAPGGQNPILNMRDVNGNILIVTGFGTTGSVAPVLAADSPEGTTVVDGTVTWTCVSPTSQGFRIDVLPSAAGPTLEIRPYYQLDPPRFGSMQQLLNPIPDSFSRFFFRGLQAQCLLNSPNPNDVKRGETLSERDQNGEPKWIKEPKKQGDRELNVYALLPACGVVEPKWGYCGNSPRTADNPYGWN
jgi:hypothetical protein